MLRLSRFSYLASALFAAIGLTVLAISIVDQPVNAKSDTVKAPIFEVDPLWPKPMPNHWLLGMACLLYTSPSPRDRTRSRMPSSA